MTARAQASQSLGYLAIIRQRVTRLKRLLRQGGLQHGGPTPETLSMITVERG